MAENHKFPIFNGDNYNSWSIRMRAYLKSQDMWELVENGYDKGDSSKFESSMHVEAKEMRMKDAKALSIILEAIPETLVPCFGDAETSKEAWTLLKQKYSGAKKKRERGQTQEECLAPLESSEMAKFRVEDINAGASKENVLQTLLGQFSDNIEVGKEVLPSTPSSSTPMTNCGYEFEVFLSFRGTDTRKGFIGHLYEAFKDRGISTFIDCEKLKKGEQIDKILEYIDKSKIFVVIFSEQYAQSRWCLKEIARSVESGKEIVPVFFGVEPSDIRNQEGTFKSAFQKHESNKKLDQAEVKKWRQAMKMVGNLSGFNLKDVNGDEAELKRAIIERVSSTVNRQPLIVAKHPIGIETRVQDVKEILENGSNSVHVVGIVGMGGLGKTTIATAVYNKLAEGFNGTTCFLSNVRENAEQPNGLVNLQKQVIHEILKDKNTYVSNVAHGASLIKERAKHKRVLLILDDVDSVEQIDALAGGRDWFGSESVIIITTRDYLVLHARHVKEHEIYKPEVLNESQSLELFLQHTFNGEEPKGDYVQLSKEVVAAAGGLPLTLEVIGSLLTCDMNVEEWKSTLEKLKNIPDEKVLLRLKLSYDKLHVFEQKIFLDIFCFFIGKERKYATYMWEACSWQPNYVIRKLKQRSLIKIDEESGEFQMHDQIRDMGRAIVNEESSGKAEKQSRLWISEDSFKLLERKGTEDVEAIKLFGGILEEVPIDIESFAAMSNLRMLLLENLTLKGEYERFPRNVKWLEWSPKDLESLPSSLYLDNIAVLDLSCSSILQVWDQQKFLHKLKVLCLESCNSLAICPDFTKMPNLEILSFENCWEMTGLHPSIGLLKKLTHLNLTNCISLMELPETIYELTSLEKLDLSYCQIITALPPQRGVSKSTEQHVLEKLKVLRFDSCSNLIMCPDFTKMPNLEILSFEDCPKLSGLHGSIGLLKKLTRLNLGDCNSLKELPETIYELTSLKKLDLSSCEIITTLPPQPRVSKSAEQHVLEKLKVLRFDYCSNLIMCPDFTKMPNLERLSFYHCLKLSGLHPSIGLLKKLTRLNLRNCNSLMELPETIYELTSLEKLDLSSCEIITALPPQPGVSKSMEQHVLEKLKILRFDYCSNLIMCPDFTKMPNLERLSFGGCMKMSELHPLIGLLKKLTILNLNGCKSLKELPEAIYELTSLEEIDLTNCEIITAFPPHPGVSKSTEQHVLGKLKVLHLDGCSNLIMCPDFTKMPNLEFLSFEDCMKMSRLHPSIWCLKSLTTLNLEYCESLKELPQEIGQMTSLEELNLYNCSQISTLPPLPPSLIKFHATGCSQLKELPQEIGQMTSLRKLDLTNCSQLKELPQEIGQMISLQALNLSDCSQVKLLPQEIGQMTSLRKFNLYNCSQLKELPQEIGQMTSLQKLDLSNCSQLKELPQEIGQMTSLQKLGLSNCSQLKELPQEIGQMTSLEELNLSNCSQLKELPQEIGQMISLQELSLFDCSQLKELPQGIGQMTSLQELSLFNCSQLKELPQEIGQVTSLKQLNLSNCSQLKELPQEIGQMTSLKQLNLSNCSQLKELPQEIGQMASLKRLNLSNCSQLKELPQEIGQMTSLLELSLFDCSQLKELPQEISQMTSLRQLSLSDCSKISTLPPLPPSLIKLYARHCSQLESIADVSNVKGLQKLDLMGCAKLVDVPGIEQLVCLECLLVAGCRRLGDSLMDRIKAANFQLPFGCSIPGRLINDGSSYPHSITFILPKLFYKSFVYLYMDESSMASICSKLEKKNGSSTAPADQSIGREDEVTIDCQRSRSVVQVDITKDDSRFSFSTFFNSWQASGKVPTATFGRDSKMMMLAKEGRFKGNMVMRVTMDGCIILNGDFYFLLDPPEADQNIAAVKFEYWED